MKRSEKEQKKRKIWPWIVGIIGVLLLGGGVYAFSVYSTLTKTVETMHQPIGREVSDKRPEQVTLTNQEPFSVLLLGVDEREGDSGRSDTMIVLTVNPEQKSSKMVSIPRDTYTEIVGKGYEDKINHAYAVGGIETSLASVENLLDIPLDYVVQVNMESFKDIVDAVGGISVENTFEFDYEGQHFNKGTLELSGEEALKYVRMRYEDPRGDFGRQDRQKQIIQGVLREGASVNSLLNYKNIFDALGKNVRTNMTFDEMVEVQANYKDAVKNVEQLHFQNGTGGKASNGIWYYYLNDEELNQVQTELKEHLEL